MSEHGKAELTNVEAVCVGMGWMKQFESKRKTRQQLQTSRAWEEPPTKPQYTVLRGRFGKIVWSLDVFLVVIIIASRAMCCILGLMAPAM